MEKKVVCLGLIFILILVGAFSNSFASAKLIDAQSVIEQVNFGANFDTVIVNYKDRELRIRLTAMTGDVERNLSNNVDFWKVRQDGTIKWGANLTVPNQAIADSLTELRYYISTENITLAQLKSNLKDGIRIKIDEEQNLFVRTERYITFGFEDLLIAPDLENMSGYAIEKIDENNAIIKLNITDVEFTSGQVVVLDPTIVVDDVNSYNSLKTNVSTSTYPLSHITPQDDDLWFYMNFDINESLGKYYDLSGHNEDGTVNNNPIWNQGGPYGGYLEFDGDSGSFNYIDIEGWSNPTCGSDEITISFWISRDTPDQTDERWVAYEYGTGTRAWMVSGSYTDNNDGRFRVDTDTGTTTLVTTSNILSPGSGWHHVVARYNGTGMSLFVDGGNEQSTAKTGPIDCGTADYDFAIGGTISGSFGELKGRLDEIMIWNRSLSNTEISDLYSNQTVRFKQPATQIFIPVNIQQDGTLNKVNITTNTTLNQGSSIQARVFAWNGTHYNDTIDGDDSGVAMRDGVVLWSHFDNDVLDYSGNGFNGTNNGGVSRDGYYNSSYYFAGSGSTDHITYGDVDDVEGINEITISVWSNITSGGSFGNDRVLVSKGNSDTLSSLSYIDGSFSLSHSSLVSPDVFFVMANSSGDRSVADCISCDRTENIWYHHVARYNGTTLSIFQNGVELATAIHFGSINNSNKPLMISKDGGSDEFEGEIDEVIIWNRSLSSGEIGELYAYGRLKYENPSPTYQQLTDGDNQVTEFNVTTNTQIVVLDFNYTASDYGFYSPVLRDNIIVTSWAGEAGVTDNEYPIFYGYWDNNGTFEETGTAYFNVSLNSTNGTVFLDINGLNYTANNITANTYNVSISFIASGGVYSYYWGSWGNGTSENYNTSNLRYYTINETEVIFNSVNITLNLNWMDTNQKKSNLFAKIFQQFSITSIAKRMQDLTIKLYQSLSITSVVNKFSLFITEVYQHINIYSLTERSYLLVRSISQPLLITSLIDHTNYLIINLYQPIDIFSQSTAGVKGKTSVSIFQSFSINAITDSIQDLIIRTSQHLSITSLFDRTRQITKELTQSLSITGLTGRLGNFVRIMFQPIDIYTQSSANIPGKNIVSIFQHISMNSIVNRIQDVTFNIYQSLNINSLSDRFYRLIRTPTDNIKFGSSFNSTVTTAGETYSRNATSFFTINSINERSQNLYRFIYQLIRFIEYLISPITEIIEEVASRVLTIYPNTNEVPYVQLNETLSFN